MQEQEILFNHTVNPPVGEAIRDDRGQRAQRKDSKKSRILSLYRGGVTDIGEIARTVPSRPSYVASVLQGAGLIHGYFDLYTTTAHDQNLYSRHFRNVLSFKTVEAAKESVARIARLYNYFERVGDRAGQHHAEVLALTGRNRARWSGKKEESRIFEQWLFNH
ncbi:MAG TPA: hypothetical protein VNI02_10010 [Blastocatellia bacterium]|nr:hypothetical protein [Blastocatellia bacterium]